MRMAKEAAEWVKIVEKIKIHKGLWLPVWEVENYFHKENNFIHYSIVGGGAEVN